MKYFKRFIQRQISGSRMRRLDSKPISKNKSEIRLFLIVRNESLRLPYFFEYYQKLGIDRFFVVDNNSTDKTQEFLLKQKNTHVFFTKEVFKRQAERFDYLLHKYGLGHWCVVVDADEFLRYPHSEKLNLKKLCKFLDSENFDALHCLLLDMYANKPLKAVTYKTGDDLLLKCPYFDSDGHTLTRQRYKETMHSVFKDGMRKRVFNMDIFLSKHPLIKFNKKMFLEWGTHIIYGEKIADIKGVSLHFKFLNDFAPRVSEEAKREAHWNDAAQYKMYNSKTSRNTSLNFYYEKSVRFKDNNQLIKLGLMKTSKEFESCAKNCLK